MLFLNINNVSAANTANNTTCTVDQVTSASNTVQSYVETNHQLPDNVNVSETTVSMPQFLELETTAVLNINSNIETSIAIENYGPAPAPRENIKSGTMGKTEYLKIANDVKSFMDSHGVAPEYAYKTSLGYYLGYQNLVYIYSQILNSYKTTNTLPSFITVTPWTVVYNTKTVFISMDQINTAAGTVQSYVETNHQLPETVSISGTSVNMPQFLELQTTSLLNINGGLYTSIVLGSFSVAPKPRDEIRTGNLAIAEYLKIASDVKSFMDSKGTAPEYAYNTSLGYYLSYQNLVYTYSQILNSGGTNQFLPNFITVTPWTTISNLNTVFISMDQINTAAWTVKSYVETNHQLPETVSISGRQINMPQFLELQTTSLLNINSGLYTSIVLGSFSVAPKPRDEIRTGNLAKTEYLKIASDVKSFMDSKGTAPEYAYNTGLGYYLSYQNLIYTYSQILNSYNVNKVLTDFITINPWTTISNPNTTLLSIGQISSAAGTVQTYVETNHQLPNNVTISGRQITMPQFLELLTTTLLDLNGNLNTNIIPGNFKTAPTPRDEIHTGNLAKTEYLKIASDVKSFMDSKGTAPEYAYNTSLGYYLSYQNLIYTYSQILNSYNLNKVLPDFITINPWTTVSNPNTLFLSMDQIKSAAGTVKSYVETNHQLPYDVTISGTAVSIPQFLELLVKSVINIYGYLDTSIVLENVGTATNPNETITSGVVLNNEFIDLANTINAYIDSNGKAPNYVRNTSLGDYMCYESLVYMYSQILNSYNVTTPLPDHVTVTPWIAVSNPNETYNFRTQEIFSSIQTAINDADTLNGDTIWLGNPNYSENILINKKITLRPVTEINVIVQALDPNLPVFTINSEGSGSTVKDLTINGSTVNAGIYINSSNNNISGNTIKGCANGVYLDKSTDNMISGNSISNNSANGVFINAGSDNTVSRNDLTYNGSGIRANNSNDNTISGNTVSHNTLDGIYLYNSSAKLNFNIIVENSRYGLYNQGGGVVDATNNWWGLNNPGVSLTNPSDVCIEGGTVNYNPWLVLTINSSCDRSDRTGTYYNYLITADLNHDNQGNDTSSEGNIPEEIPINFNTTLGTINTSESTKKGKSVLKLTSTAAGTANVSATMDNQTASISVDITGVDVLGIYNTRTQKGFTTIQSAINDLDTLNGDTITLKEGTYTENVALDKKLTLKPADGEKVTVKSSDSDKSAFVINNGGSGSTIQGLNIIGSADSYGVALSHSFSCNISGNTISNSNRGVYLYLSGNNNVTGNILKNNYYGIVLYKSTSNNLSGGIIKDNENGIYFYNSNNNQITGSTVADNWYGTYLYYSSNNSVAGNTVEGNWTGIYLYNTNNNSITENNITDNGCGISYYDSNSTNISGNSFRDNWITDTSQIDSGKMVMATTIYSCGAAALATVLKTMGIYATEAEIAKLAGTNETGTSLDGLVQAAQAKGVTATGVRISTDQLKANYIVVLSINGYNHFEVINNITSTTVYLMDPNLGTIEMSLTKFKELYTGVALIINNTIPANATLLTKQEMQNIKAMWHTETIQHSYWVSGYWYVTWEWIDTSFWVPYFYWQWVPGYYWCGWLPIPGHYELCIGWYYVECGFWWPEWHYVWGYWATYYTTEWVPDWWDINPEKAFAVAGGIYAIASGFTAATALVIAAPETGGISLAGMGVAWAEIGFGVASLKYSEDDPWWLNKPIK